MGLQLTTNQTSSYRTHFSKRFLKTLVDTLVLDQFATKEALPSAAGADTVRFFVEPSGSASDVLTLSEGTAETTTYSDNDLSYVDVQLGFYGDKQKISNRLSLTSFFDRVKSSSRKMGLSAAIFSDNLIRNAIVSGVTSAGYKRYAGGAANFNALVALSAANGAWTPILGLAAITKLKTAKATPLPGGDFIHVVPPQISYDLVQHTKWETPNLYSGSKQIFKGELGRLYGARYVEATNPWIEDSNNDTEGSYNGTTGSIYTVLTLGEESVGFVDLAGAKSPMSPKMDILDKPDKSDPHNQFIVTAWSAYAAAKLLSTSRAITTRCKSTFS